MGLKRSPKEFIRICGVPVWKDFSRAQGWMATATGKEKFMSALETSYAAQQFRHREGNWKLPQLEFEAFTSPLFEQQIVEQERDWLSYLMNQTYFRENERKAQERLTSEQRDARLIELYYTWK
jgi:hypothetical protein